VAIENATRLQPRRSGRPTYATVRRKRSVCRSLPKSYGFYSYIFRRPQRTGGRSPSIELPPSTMDARYATAAVTRAPRSRVRAGCAAMPSSANASVP
jgi:hypothetical protein